MRKFLTAALAALTFGGAIAASTTPAQAQRYGHGHGRYYGGHHRDNTGAAVAAGVVGLALGAALASDSPRRYYDGGGYYDRRAYYAPPRGDYGGPYDYGYRTCESRDWGYDPYTDRRVMVTRRYAC